MILRVCCKSAIPLLNSQAFIGNPRRQAARDVHLGQKSGLSRSDQQLQPGKKPRSRLRSSKALPGLPRRAPGMERPFRLHSARSYAQRRAIGYHGASPFSTNAQRLWTAIWSRACKLNGASEQELFFAPEPAFALELARFLHREFGECTAFPRL